MVCLLPLTKFEYLTDSSYWCRKRTRIKSYMFLGSSYNTRVNTQDDRMIWMSSDNVDSDQTFTPLNSPRKRKQTYPDVILHFYIIRIRKVILSGVINAHVWLMFLFKLIYLRILMMPNYFPIMWSHYNCISLSSPDPMFKLLRSSAEYNNDTEIKIVQWNSLLFFSIRL